MRHCFCPLLLIGAFALGGCEASKSSSPLSPAVAGPIAGVAIAAPEAISPAPGSRIAAQEPVIFMVKNAVTTGVRPLSYTFELASDSGFIQKLYSRAGVGPGGDGQTSHRMPDALSPGHLYYWRARAEDGANTGAFTAAVGFTVFTPVVIEAPAPLEPVNGSTVSATRPVFVVSNAKSTGPVGAIAYQLDMALDVAFTQRVFVGNFPEQVSQTRMAPDQDLPAGRQIFWRVSAGDSENRGPWTTIQAFTTSVAPAAPSPAPSPSPSPSPSPGPAGNDQIDLRTVTVVKGVNISNWRITSTITGVTISGGEICTDHTMAGRWPREIWFGDPSVLVEANQWIFANIGGLWYGGAGEWMRPGQVCKQVGDIGSGVFYDSPPMRDWSPRTGEMVGFAVSTPARAGQWGIAERSNVVLVRWP